VSQLPAPIRGSEAPKPRPGWLKVTTEAFAAYWDDSISGILTPAAVPVVMRYYSLLDEWHRALREVRRQRVTVGSMGQPRVNPSSGYLLGLEDRLQRLEGELGLSPAARSRLRFEEATTTATLDRLFCRARGEAE
jgi:P27 family predicted phage terminase small subunit